VNQSCSCPYLRHQVPGSGIVLVGTHSDRLQTNKSPSTSHIADHDVRAAALSANDKLQQQLRDILYSIRDAEGKSIENIRSELTTLK